MELPLANYGTDELIRLRLRGLFERRGFRRARVNKFEDYALYVENKNFLHSDNIITFMDMDGKLLALKPDVTLSIVRGVPNRPLPVPEKLYYIDEVYRLSRKNREYKVHKQIGVELIGQEDGFSNIEVVDLALQSLSMIGESFVLDISHLGFISGFMDSLALSEAAKKQVLAGIHSKSGHDVAAALTQAGVSQENVNRALTLCGLYGRFPDILPRAKDLIVCGQMQDAYDELSRLGEVMRPAGGAGRMNLDFSVVNDLDYYNGLIFSGYVEGVPKAALTGGRYDNLMRKMGKQSGAIGFAVSLGDIAAYLRTGRANDVDLLLLYPEDCDYAALLEAVREKNEQGLSVRLERADCDLSQAGFTWGTLCRFDGNDFIQEGASC